MAGHDPQTLDRQGTAVGVLARLFWMLVGNAILLFSLIFLLHNKGGWLHTADVVFWITVGVLVLVRYLDIRFCNGLTAAGAPASRQHWVKYVVMLLVVSTTTWVLAHAANYLFVARVAEV
jgi:hypothetical protein